MESVDPAMSGLRDSTIAGLAPELLGAGVSPSRIAGKALSSRQWTGSEAGALRNDLEFFAALSEQHPELAEVCAEAAGQLETEVDVAAAKERQERLLGW